MNIWAVKNNTYYRITYAAQASEFDKYLEPVEKMIGSVKILEAPAPVLMVADANLHARSTTNVTAGAATVKP